MQHRNRSARAVLAFATLSALLGTAFAGCHDTAEAPTLASEPTPADGTPPAPSSGVWGDLAVAIPDTVWTTAAPCTLPVEYLSVSPYLGVPPDGFAVTGRWSDSEHTARPLAASSSPADVSSLDGDSLTTWLGVLGANMEAPGRGVIPSHAFHYARVRPPYRGGLLARWRYVWPNGVEEVNEGGLAYVCAVASTGSARAPSAATAGGLTVTIPDTLRATPYPIMQPPHYASDPCAVPVEIHASAGLPGEWTSATVRVTDVETLRTTVIEWHGNVLTDMLGSIPASGPVTPHGEPATIAPEPFTMETVIDMRLRFTRGAVADSLDVHSACATGSIGDPAP